ncbi:MAG: hypothetical protein LBB59_00755 [Campylobacteraceae bacterium]|jgi:hypothetical protein|nr:hypothetical protein [Campylobacteraceae bacterium]
MTILYVIPVKTSEALLQSKMFPRKQAKRFCEAKCFIENRYPNFIYICAWNGFPPSLTICVSCGNLSFGRGNDEVWYGNDGKKACKNRIAERKCRKCRIMACKHLCKNVFGICKNGKNYAPINAK